MIEHHPESLTLTSRRFRLRLSTAAGTTRLLEDFSIARHHEGRFDVGVPLVPWTGFGGITSHTREFFIATDGPQSPRVEVLTDTPEQASVRYGPLTAASWEVWWTITLTGEELHWDVLAVVGRQTRTDDEINLLAFDVPEGEEFIQARFDTGYILPPKEWFAIPAPAVTYRGNDFAGNVLDRRVRLRFCGDGHETLYLDFAGGYGLSLTCHGDNDFRLVPKVILKPDASRAPTRLPPARFGFRAHERFAIGTNLRPEARGIPARTRLDCSVIIRAYEPEAVETMCLETPEPAVAERTVRFHRTHAHGSVAHKWGFAGGWHNTGLPDGHSVSFEYYMHGKAHFFGLDPTIDRLMANALDSVWQRETQPDGLIWQHGFAGRGFFQENNASMLVFLADYVRRTGDLSRLSYGRKWADYILSRCMDEPFLFRVPTSTGVPGFGRGSYICNWWDVVGCGGHDGFINVLTYPGLRDLAAMEAAAGHADAARRYADAAERLRRSFNDFLWDEAAGRYISWVDTEGGRHDYFFTSVNLIAACEGIADQPRRRRILDGIAARLREINYGCFSLPGNLISIPPEHYNAGDWWLEQYGYPHFYDAFGTYENGGVWPWVSAYYIAAVAEFDPDRAYDHYLAILDQYDRDNLQGAGNGYFWDPQTGEITEGSMQEPYLANSAMAIWGFMSLFGLRFGFDGAISIRPRLPKRLESSRFAIRHHGRRIEFRFHGCGTTVESLIVNNHPHTADQPVPVERLPDGSVVEVQVR